MLRAPIALTVLVLLGGCSGVPRSFQPAEPLAPQQFSYQPLQEVLRAHVTEGVVDYSSIAVDPRFAAFLHQLDRLDPNRLPTRSDRLAFWINAYNAFAIKGILDGYSPLPCSGDTSTLLDGLIGSAE